MAQRVGSVGSIPASGTTTTWASAAAAASADAQVNTKVIKKKTRGVKVSQALPAGTVLAISHSRAESVCPWRG